MNALSFMSFFRVGGGFRATAALGREMQRAKVGAGRCSARLVVRLPAVAVAVVAALAHVEARAQTPPDPPVPNVVVMAAAADALIVTWGEVENRDTSFVRWAEGAGSTKWINPNGSEGESPGGQRFVILNLTAGTLYDVQVGVRLRGAGTVAMWPSASVPGTPAAQANRPAALAAPRAFPYLDELSSPGRVALFLEGAPADVGYVKRMRQKDPPGNWIFETSDAVGQGPYVSIFRLRLTSRVVAEVQQAALTDTALGAWSPVTETLTGGTPDVPTGVSAEAGEARLTLKWTRPAFAGGRTGNEDFTDIVPVAGKYYARWRVKDTDSVMTGNQPGDWLNKRGTDDECNDGRTDTDHLCGELIAQNASPDEQSTEIRGLAGGTEYEVQLRMRHGLTGDRTYSEWSASVSVTPIAPTVVGTPQQRADATLSALKIDTNEATVRTLLGASGATPAPLQNFAPAAAAQTYDLGGVANAVATLDIAAAVNFTQATLTIDNTSDTSTLAAILSPVNDLALVPGPNVIEVVVTSADAMMTKKYTVNVFRAGPVSLIELNTAPLLANITLTPVFDPLKQRYTGSVPGSATELSSVTTSPTGIHHFTQRVMPLPASAISQTADVTASTRISLAAGVNVIEVAIGGAKYIFTITRGTVSAAERADASLSSLIVSTNEASRDDIVLLGTSVNSPVTEFARNTRAYAFRVSNSAASLDISATVNFAAAKVTSIDNTSDSVAAVTTSSTGDLALVVGGNVIEIVVTALGGGTATYALTITRAARDSSNPLVPQGAPHSVTFAISSETLRLSWEAPDDDGGADISDYVVRWALASAPNAYLNANGAAGASSGIDDLMHTIRNLTNGLEYEVQIAAVNRIGSGAWSEVHRNNPAQPPQDAPGNLMVQAGAGLLMLFWEAPSNNGGDNITGYTVRWAEGNDSSVWVPPGGGERATGSPALRYVLHGLKAATTYEVQVAAHNDAGAGPWTASVEGVTASFDMDVDASGAVDSTDALLVARYLTGLRGAALTANLYGTSSPPNAATVAAKINSGVLQGVLNIDGENGTTAADGIMLARYYLGVTEGEALTAGMSDTPHATVKENIENLPQPQ
ncbi:MAG: fibronectin type III domain-containing protein [Gammaproteobacteria bacterium]